MTATALRPPEQVSAPPAPSAPPGPRAFGLVGRLSIVVAITMAVAASWGLADVDLYQDAPSLRSMLRGHDLVTLAVAVPVLVAGVAGSVLSPSGGWRARAFWLGGLAFATYNYAVYVFGTAFNDLFLLHMAILVAAAIGLGAGIVTFEPPPPAGRRPARVAAGLMGFLAAGLAGMWVFNALRFAFTGDAPVESGLVLPLSSTHLGYALDLTLIVPTYAVAAIWLWRGNRWGSSVAPVLLVGGLLQQLTYLSALVFQVRADIPGAVAFDPGELVVIAAYVAALAQLLRRRPQPQPHNPPGAVHGSAGAVHGPAAAPDSTPVDAVAPARADTLPERRSP